MASQLRDMVDKKVLVVTCDGRIICGLLKGFDRQTNLILASSQERLYSLEAGVEIVYLGLYVLRGTNVSIAGEVDLDADRKIDFPSVRALKTGGQSNFRPRGARRDTEITTG